MASNLEFLKSVEVTSAVTNIDITDCFSADYDVYAITISDLDIANLSNIVTRFLDSTNTVISATEYDNADLQVRSDSAFVEHRSTSQAQIQYIASLGSVTANSNGTVIYVYNPYDSSSYTFVQWQSSGYTGALRGYKGIAVHKSAEQINGIRFFQQSGDTEQGLFAVYGVK